jgi:hypothetical protein
MATVSDHQESWSCRTCSVHSTLTMFILPPTFILNALIHYRRRVCTQLHCHSNCVVVKTCHRPAKYSFPGFHYNNHWNIWLIMVASSVITFHWDRWQLAIRCFLPHHRCQIFYVTVTKLYLQCLVEKSIWYAFKIHWSRTANRQIQN